MSGTEANNSGKVFELQNEQVLRSNQIGYWPQYRTGWVSVLKKEIKSDFYLNQKPVGFEDGLHCEVRWQDSEGSADEKICYLLENIRTVYQRPAVVVLGGASIDAQYDYLKDRVDGKKLCGVFRLEEFITFAKTLRIGAARSHIQKIYNPSQRQLFTG